MTRVLLVRMSLSALLLAACAPAPASRSDSVAGARVWFDAPLPGTVLAAYRDCEIVAHAYSPRGLKESELLINGIKEDIQGTASPDDSMMSYGRDCSNFAPGEYVLQLRVKDNDQDWSQNAQTSLTVTDGPRFTPSPPPEAVATPTRTPASGGGSVSIESVSSHAVYSGDETCGSVEVTITARALAPKGITVVVLFYRVEPGSLGTFQNAVMSPSGRGLYERTISPNAALDGAAEGVLEYQVVVQQSDGDTSVRTPLMSDIAVQPCGAVTGPGPSAAGCSRYTTKRSCESHGCTWVLLPAIFPVYACGNP